MASTPAELIKVAPCKLRIFGDEGLFAWKSSRNTSFAVPLAVMMSSGISVAGEMVLGNDGDPREFSAVDTEPISALLPVDTPPHPANIAVSFTVNIVLK